MGSFCLNLDNMLTSILEAERERERESWWDNYLLWAWEQRKLERFERKTERQTDRQIDRQTEGERDNEIEMLDFDFDLF